MLLRAQQRHRFRVFWFVAIALLLLLVLTWLYYAAASIRTHTLPVGEIQLSVPYSKYLVDEPITFTVKNNYNSPVYFANACPQEPLSVYRLVKGVWLRIHDTASLRDCPDENRQILVPANGSVNGNFGPWHNLFNQPGRYRVVAYVEYYSALPYQEFDVIAAPPIAPSVQSPAAVVAAAIATDSTPSVTPPYLNSDIQTDESIRYQAPPPKSTPPPATNYVPRNYPISVNSSGNYNTTSLSLHVGDTLTILYAAPYNNEVRTSFRPLGTTGVTIGSVTVDSEFTTRTITISNKGTWAYKADDYNGNSGILTVN